MRILVLALALAVGAAACGGTDTTSTGDAAGGTDPAATAEANAETLQSNDDVRLIEVLDVSDGSITTLGDAVDGDRPVLVWFWAPH